MATPQILTPGDVLLYMYIYIGCEILKALMGNTLYGPGGFHLVSFYCVFLVYNFKIEN